MAEETETQGSEFPIFKSGEGAFDRAKYDEQSKARFKSDGIKVTATGKEIDDDLKKKKVSADDVIKEANKFYDNEFQKNLKALDPAYDPKLIYYLEAYSDGGSNRKKIKRKIEKGEAVDGKEIFEMSKGAAENKIGNAQKLKTGNVTQIVENLGLKNIKQFDLYEDIKSDFDSKVKDENSKFDPLLKKFSAILRYFNGGGGPMTTQKSATLYTPENNSIIAALAKILEEQGFNSESVLNTSKRYDDNLAKLVEKSKGESIESLEMTKEGDVVKKGEGVTEEKKLEEKKEETPAASPPVAPVEEPKVAPLEPAVETKTTEVGSPNPVSSEAETKLEEAKSSIDPTETAGSTVKSEPLKIDSVSKDSKVDSMIKDLFGIDLSATGVTGETGETGKGELEEVKLASKKAEDLFGIDLSDTGETEGTGGTGKGELEAVKLAEKKADDLFGSPKEDVGSTGVTGGKEPEKKKEETKLETKIDRKNEKVNETLPVSTGKIETTAQNLFSVSAPVEKLKEPEPTAINTSTTSNTSSNEGSSGTTTTETPMSETAKDEKKVGGNKTEGEGEGNKEMLDTMKSMVSLLTQLNSTMQGPLIVTPTNKKF